MGKFMRNFVISLICTEVFFVFGGGLLLDLNRNYYFVPVIIALVIAVVTQLFSEQDARIAELEKRIEELEKNKSSQV